MEVSQLTISSLLKWPERSWLRRRVPLPESDDPAVLKERVDQLRLQLIIDAMTNHERHRYARAKYPKSVEKALGYSSRALSIPKYQIVVQWGNEAKR
jgi:hypothetical protein